MKRTLSGRKNPAEDPRREETHGHRKRARACRRNQLAAPDWNLGRLLYEMPRPRLVVRMPGHVLLLQHPLTVALATQYITRQSWEVGQQIEHARSIPGFCVFGRASLDQSPRDPVRNTRAVPVTDPADRVCRVPALVEASAASDGCDGGRALTRNQRGRSTQLSVEGHLRQLPRLPRSRTLQDSYGKDAHMGWLSRRRGIESESPEPNDVLTVIPIEHEVSQDGDAAAFAGWLYANLMGTRAAIQQHRTAVEFVWEGYSDDPRELWLIPEVVAFNRDLNARWPCALYFLRPGGNAMLVMVFSLLGATLVREPVAGRAVSQVDRRALSELISTSWEPTLRKVAGLAGVPDVLVEDMLRSATSRFPA